MISPGKRKLRSGFLALMALILLMVATPTTGAGVAAAQDVSPDNITRHLVSVPATRDAVETTIDRVIPVECLMFEDGLDLPEGEFRIKMTYHASLASSNTMEISLLGGWEIWLTAPDSVFQGLITSSSLVTSEGYFNPVRQGAGNYGKWVPDITTPLTHTLGLSDAIDIEVTGGVFDPLGDLDNPGSCVFSTTFRLKMADHMLEQYVFDGPKGFVRGVPIFANSDKPLFDMATDWVEYTPTKGTGPVQAYTGWTGPGALTGSGSAARHIYVRGAKMYQEAIDRTGGRESWEVGTEGFPVNLKDITALITFPQARNASNDRCPNVLDPVTKQYTAKTDLCLRFSYWAGHIGGTTLIPIDDSNGRVRFPLDDENNVVWWHDSPANWAAKPSTKPGIAWSELNYVRDSPGGRHGGYQEAFWEVSAGQVLIFNDKVRQTFWHSSNQGDGEDFSSGFIRDVDLVDNVPKWAGEFGDPIDIADSDGPMENEVSGLATHVWRSFDRVGAAGIGDPVPLPAVTCGGRNVTVNLAAGDRPTSGNDVILGTAGDDIIAAGAGNDVVCGLGGDDTIWGQNGDDVILGGGGNDRLRGGSGADTLRGGLGNDDLAGGAGDDQVYGEQGNDTKVRGGTGEDLVDGGDGNDLLVAGNGGEDTVRGGTGNDKVTGGPRPDVVDGGAGNDEVRGNKGADELLGGTGNDSLFGGPQPDELNGGAGTDACNGGTTTTTSSPESDVAVRCEGSLINVP